MATKKVVPKKPVIKKDDFDACLKAFGAADLEYRTKDTVSSMNAYIKARDAYYVVRNKKAGKS